jgi:predicted extracellular nuclease
MRLSFISTALVAGALLAAAPANAAPSPDVVISEVYGGGGNNTATLTNDFIELYNKGSAAVDLSTWSVQYGSAAGNFSGRTNLTGSIQPGQYYLVQEAAGAGGTQQLPKPDATGTIAMSGTDGKVALVTSQATQACGAAATPCTGNAAIRDLVGYGGSSASETAPTARLSNSTSASRKGGGATDTDNNAADFTTGEPTPRNSTGEGPGSQEPVPGTPSRIHDVQGARHLSPLQGDRVAVPGIVTAVSRNGYWIQDPNPDDDPRTSEGIWVFRGTGAAVGDAVTVHGNVNEFHGSAGGLSLTELENSYFEKTGTGSIAPTLVGPGGLIPPTTVIEDDASDVEDPADNEFDPQQDGIDWHESLEGMLVRINAPQAVGPTNGFGETATVPEGIGGPFTPRGGIYITPEDFNPERMIFDDVVADVPDVNTGDAFKGPVDAVVDYAFDNYKYYPTATPERIDNGLQQEVTDAKRANQLAISSMNVENLDALDPQDKFDGLAKIVVDHLRSPDILAVEEIQDNDGAKSPAPAFADATYARFIEAIADAGGPTYDYRQIDPNAGRDGGETPGNIRVGFLFRTDGDLEFVDRPGATANTPNRVFATRKGARLEYSPGRIDPNNAAFLTSRKPLAAEFLWKGRTVFAIANHFNSKGGDEPLFGSHQPPEQSSTVQRHKQANVLAGFVEKILAADPRAAIAVMGDFNDFQFSETLGILEGAGLANLMETLPENEQYSYVFDGNSQVLDQILVSKELETPKPEYDSVHVNAEFTDQASDHDPQVARVVVRGTANAK